MAEEGEISQKAIRCYCEWLTSRICSATYSIVNSYDTLHCNPKDALVFHMLDYPRDLTLMQLATVYNISILLLRYFSQTQLNRECITMRALSCILSEFSRS